MRTAAPFAPIRTEAIRVIGVGNPWRGDDAVGQLVAREVGSRLPPGASGEVAILECRGDAVELLEAWSGAEVAIVVDAIISGAVPGSVQRFDATTRALPGGCDSASTSCHALGVREALELGRALCRLPRRVTVYGIEATRLSAPGLAPAVADAISAAADQILAELRHPAS